MGTIKIEINGRIVDVDDSFTGMSEAEQHQVIDEIAANLPKTNAAATPQQQQKGPEVTSNAIAGAEAGLLRAGVGVPKAALGAMKNYFTGTPGAAPSAPPANDIGSIRKWLGKETSNPFAGGRTKEEAYLKSEIAAGKPIQSRGSDIGIRRGNLGINNQIVEPTGVQKIAGGLDRGLAHPSGKAFTAGYNAMDAAEHVGEGPLSNVQAAASTAAAAAPYIEKYLPTKLKKVAKVAPFAVPAVNYGIDTLRNALPQPPVEEKAAGGLAGYAGGSTVKKALEFTGSALKPLLRAPPKTKAEIEAIALRMAPQERGEFVRAPGKTTSVAGTSKKQYDRELGLQHDIRNVVGTEGLPEIDYSKRIGDVAMMLPGDKSIVGDIHSVAGIPLEKAVRAEGGKGFPVHHALANPNTPPELWTSTGQVAKNYQNLGRKVASEYGAENVLPHYANMPQGMGYSQHFADTLLRGLRPAGADLGKATDMMRTGSFKGKSFPNFPGFEDMDKVYDLMKHDPEMRQLFTNRLQVQDVAKSLGLPPTYGTDALHAVTAPSLRNLETGAGGHMIGNLDLHREMSPSTHAGYTPDRDPGLNIPGEAIGRTSHATPYEMLYPDLLHDIRSNPITYETKSGKAMIVPEFGRLKMDSPRQLIDNQFVDEMEQYKEAMKKITGKKKGGLATLAKKKK